MFWTVLIFVVAAYFLLDRIIRLFKVGNYRNKFVFVTGCDTGFGKELAIRLDKLGFPVFAGCFTEEGARYLSEVCSSRLVTLSLNVADNDSIGQAYEFVKQRLPSENSLWAVVNNAGVAGPLAPVEFLKPADYIFTFGPNLLGPMEVARVFLPLLRRSQGRVVFMTSVMGRCPATPTPYSVSKFGLEAFGDVLRREVSAFGVKVSMIEPGYFRTNILDEERARKEATNIYNKATPEIQAAYGHDFIEKTIATVKAALQHSSPDTYKVVDAYIAAITSSYPRPRYVVGFDAKFIFLPLSFLPECFLEWFQARQQKHINENFR